MWFTDSDGNTGDGRIGRITTAGVITEFAILTPFSGPIEITTGPDGNLWFTEQGGNKIGRITTAGVITEFAIPTAFSGLFGIATGPDGNVWFTEAGVSKIGRITMAGVVTEFRLPTPHSGPVGIATGPDGNLWFTAQGSNMIGRITTAGVVTEFTLPVHQPDGNGPLAITTGPDGNLWFSEYFSAKIGRMILPQTTNVPAPTPITSFWETYTNNNDDYHDSTTLNSDPKKAVPFIVWSGGALPSDIVHFTLNLGYYMERSTSILRSLSLRSPAISISSAKTADCTLYRPAV